ncbi:hypothetical protein GCM10027299_02860 [Larkinella ripae]
MEPQNIIRQAYQAFNDRTIDAVLALLTPEVQWPNGWEGGYVIGTDQVRAYWLRQWQELDPIVQPVSMQETADGQVDVKDHQVVKDRSGQLIFDGFVRHVYTFEGGKISRMAIVED